jgi:hypothetical protein
MMAGYLKVIEMMKWVKWKDTMLRKGNSEVE